uniref:Carboxylesterase n=1 Tax=Pseudomonas fluorescens TaxID=294 RepID=Q8VU79_PSEFL|nr:carboxylesterase [Pseudomonas fluorescens]
MQIQGHYELQFEAVREAFAALFDDPQERGAGLCIQIGGETVVDLWAGTADKDGAEAWHSDTIVNLFSCTKTFTAVTALQLVAEGKLQLDAPVANYWPEFAAAGKETITLRHLLCHQAGLPAIREMLPTEALYDWQLMVDTLAAEAPWWTPGQGHGYEAITYGWLVGELLRRADGRGPGESIVARVARPLGLDFHVGLADAEFYRVAHIARSKGNMGDEAAQRVLQFMMREPSAITHFICHPPSILTLLITPEWSPAHRRNVTYPPLLAGFYSGLLDGSLLEADMLEQLTREHSIGPDKTLLTQTRFGLGCMLDQPQLPNATFGLGPRAFGHPGAGGSVGFADPEHDVAFGFVTNTLGPYVLMDPRAQKLVGILAGCL